MTGFDDLTGVDTLIGSALYLYCVAPAESISHLSAPALDGGVVHTIRYRDLVVLAHACAPEPYQGSEEKVRGWIAAHNAVVDEAWERAKTVLPMSFDVIVTGDADRSAERNLVGWLAEYHTALQGRLQALRGRAEVGVQILWDIESPTAARSPVETTDAQTAGSGPARGHAYFARQRQLRRLRDEFASKAAADGHRYQENLATLADDVQINRPRPVKGKHIVVNLSLLVARTMISQVGEYLGGVGREPGVEVRFTGPWPPYSFAGTFGMIGNKTDAGSEGKTT